MKFSQTHEWIKVEGQEGVIGISNHAQNQLSDVVFVDLPEVGTEIIATENFMVIESVKAASDIYAPVSGKIIAVNEQLENKPELINESPESKGWLVKINITDDSALAELQDKEDYLQSIGD